MKMHNDDINTLNKGKNMYATNTKCLEYIEYVYLDHIQIPQKL